jgi:cytochrome c-type biogenesis protein CcmH
VDDAEFLKAARTILCDCGCHPQSVYDCACGRAAEMREEIAAQLRQGNTGDEVIDSYVARHGEQIRIAPLARGFNLVAWVGPGLGLLAAAAGTALVLRRWLRRLPAEQAPAPAARPGVRDEEYRARLDAALREYDA